MPLEADTHYAATVARIPLVDPGDPDLDPAVHEIYTQLTRSGVVTADQIHNVIRAMANHVGLLEGLLNGLSSSVYGPHVHITPAQRELAYLTASVINSCHY
jgi:hypothetical protein